MHLYKTPNGIVLKQEDTCAFVAESWDNLVRRDDLGVWLRSQIISPSPEAAAALAGPLLPPIGSQEVWASGVTYQSSRLARMEESKAAGGGDFYARVYNADRPELFFKSTAPRVRGHGQSVRIRRDSTWDVPEPELTLVLSASGKIVAYSIGNDMSSRSIEGENPLYLPQAKTYEAAAGIGPCLYIPDTPIPLDTAIRIQISRNGSEVFSGETTLSAMKRTLDELADWLFREMDFPDGAYLMTGTGIVPGPDFTLQPGDQIAIEIAPIGRLVQTVER